MNLVPHLTSPHSVYLDMCREKDDRDLMSSLFPYNRDCWHTYVWSTIHQVVTCYRYEHKSTVYITSILCFYIKNMTKDIKKREYYVDSSGRFLTIRKCHIYYRNISVLDTSFCVVLGSTFYQVCLKMICILDTITCNLKIQMHHLIWRHMLLSILDLW